MNLIGTGGLALLQHPDQLVRLREEPDLAPTAVGELLRFVVPAETATARYAREDLEIAGTPIPRGSLVLLVVANRDPGHFPEPDRLDLGRTPNRHSAFGQGVHDCVGPPLARVETAVALPALLRRGPDLRLAVPADTLRWRGGLVLRGVESLPVAARRPGGAGLAQLLPGRRTVQPYLVGWTAAMWPSGRTRTVAADP